VTSGSLPLGFRGWAEYVGAQVVACDSARGECLDRYAAFGGHSLALTPFGYRWRFNAKQFSQPLLSADFLNYGIKRVSGHGPDIRMILITSQQGKPNSIPVNI